MDAHCLLEWELNPNELPCMYWALDPIVPKMCIQAVGLLPECPLLIVDSICKPNILSSFSSSQMKIHKHSASKISKLF